ncbi:TPA: hypothetical protein JG825_003440 [Vibrio parahaemolyticus]|uniref:hypothetical protein n=1 Tax=Vibrio TaxID=662 RepID=UPI0018F10EB8|nr:MULTISPECIES: hypothetical protein [Vibrio]MDK9774800.1 hypothetical protein [Vibrio sp. B181a]UPR19097.1 hypothetical protein H9J99_25980 [Vibrio parahaemolyticus]WJT11088.1 hypothetical protein PH545_28510 [Vibrio harveyi]HAV1520121.1 hypothetical protein [Vibrio parahaemolyticus]HAV1539088.1 hypothetical protein [Vibrio parahaemolyticus]
MSNEKGFNGLSLLWQLVCSILSIFVVVSEASEKANGSQKSSHLRFDDNQSDDQYFDDAGMEYHRGLDGKLRNNAEQKAYERNDSHLW